MNRKGQIISLDFLISLAMVFLAFGTLIGFYELNSYSQKQEMERAALKMVVENAADLMLSSPGMVCEVVDDTNQDHSLFYLNGCLSKGRSVPPQHAPAWGKRKKGKSKGIWKTFLGIPSNYDCNISIEGGGLQSGGGNKDEIATDCSLDPPADVKNVYSATKGIVVFSQQDKYLVPKSEFIKCRNKDPACELVDGNITIKVWKNV